MSIEESFGNYFKAEIKASGRKLVAEDKLSLSIGSDTSIQAFVQASPPVKVLFRSAGIGSPTFIADCNCPMRKKRQFCKHVWATLVAVERDHPDFLSAKTSIDKAEIDPETKSGDSYVETAKARANEYRKDQYQKQKVQAKAHKRAKRAEEDAVPSSSFPAEIAASLEYFSLNGFPMPTGPVEETIAEAKRKLSRVFHPDKGGHHDEIVELNRNCEVLMRFLGY
jgi:hypothetical protein